MWASLPSRERGLKSTVSLPSVSTFLSLPSRERGLKSTKTDNKTTTVVVAPFAGARIEIPEAKENNAWEMSLPSRERGLKLLGCCISKKSYRRSLRGSAD